MITIPWGNKKGMLQLDGKTGFWGVEFSGVKLHHLEAAVKGADGALERSSFRNIWCSRRKEKMKLAHVKRLHFFIGGHRTISCFRNFACMKTGR